MTERDVILVGVDGSATSLHALDWATAEAAAMGWSLHLACSYGLPSFAAATLDGGYAAIDDSAIQAGARAVLDEAAQRVGDRVPVTTTLATGDAAAALVELSATAGLVVVGTRGRGGFADRLLGTVSSALPAHAHCPTVVVPLRASAEVGDIPPVPPIRRIVVGMDGSPPAEAALKAAIKQAVVWDAEVTAVAAVPVSSGAGLLAWLPSTVDHEAVLADVGAGLDVVVDRVLQDYPGVTVKRHALDGVGAALLTEFSTAVDLLVVGSRGRGGFAGLLLGSTSQAVLHHAVCPVMVVTLKGWDEGVSPTAVGDVGR